MQTLTYFYEEILTPVLDTVVSIARRVGEYILLLLLWVSIPLWLPFFLIRKKKEKAEKEDETNAT